MKIKKSKQKSNARRFKYKDIYEDNEKYIENLKQDEKGKLISQNLKDNEFRFTLSRLTHSRFPNKFKEQYEVKSEKNKRLMKSPKRINKISFLSKIENKLNNSTNIINSTKNGESNDLENNNEM